MPTLAGQKRGSDGSLSQIIQSIQLDVVMSGINSTISAFRNITLYGLAFGILVYSDVTAFQTSFLYMGSILVVGLITAFITHWVLVSFDQYYTSIFEKLSKIQDDSLRIPSNLKNKLHQISQSIDQNFAEERTWISLITFLFDLVMFIQLLTVLLTFCGINFVPEVYCSVALLSLGLAFILYKTMRQQQIDKDYMHERNIILFLEQKSSANNAPAVHQTRWTDIITPIADCIMALAAVTCMVAVKEHRILSLLLNHLNILIPTTAVIGALLIAYSFQSRRFRYFAIALFFGTTAYYTFLITFSSLITYYVSLPSSLMIWISSTGFLEPIWLISTFLGVVITGFFLRSFLRNDDVLSIAEFTLESTIANDLNNNPGAANEHHRRKDPENSINDHQHDEGIEAGP